jgi:hypothetical protein
MHASLGDHIVIRSSQLDKPKRHGEIIEVMEAHDAQHYRVRWDDGHESIFYPGPDAHLEQYGTG